MTEREAMLVGALLDIEHEVTAAESARDMFDAVTAIVEKHLGRPPRPYAPRRSGEPAVTENGGHE